MFWCQWTFVGFEEHGSLESGRQEYNTLVHNIISLIDGIGCYLYYRIILIAQREIVCRDISLIVYGRVYMFISANIFSPSKSLWICLQILHNIVHITPQAIMLHIHCIIYIVNFKKEINNNRFGAWRTF